MRSRSLRLRDGIVDLYAFMPRWWQKRRRAEMLKTLSPDLVKRLCNPGPWPPKRPKQ